MQFEVIEDRSEGGSVGPRLGRLRFAAVEVATPVFMPVGTAASVKALTSQDVWEMGFRLILGNTYHLALRPGMEVLQAFGGLHRFMQWPGAILTDSGGFQVMSLAKTRKITESSVTFANHINGARLELSPENAASIQQTIGANIQMVLDECTPHPATWEEARLSMERSMRWAKRARSARTEGIEAQFGIVQGGMYPDLRARSATELREMGFEGYAIGGLSVGEPKEEMRRVLSATMPALQVKEPRYLMGVGAPDDVFDAVLAGIDMFDCVMPTRNARNGTLFVRTAVEPTGKLHIRNAKHRMAEEPIDPECCCLACQSFSRAYLRHLHVSKELASYRLLTLHNLQFMADFMEEIRQALKCEDWKREMERVRERFV